MQYIQNSAARLITKKRKFDSISPILQELHWLPIKSRIKFKLLTMVFRCIQALLQYTCKKSYSPTNPSAIYVLTLKSYLTKCELELNCLVTEHLLRLQCTRTVEFPSTIPERHHIFRPIQIKIKNILISKWLISLYFIIDFGSYFSHSSFSHARIETLGCYAFSKKRYYYYYY